MAPSGSTSEISSNSIHDDSKVLLELMSPDGYYRYLGVTKPSMLTTASNTDPTDTSSSSSSSSSTSSTTGASGGASEKEQQQQQEFIDSVKKSYRKLSLKHHPDKSGGNVDTFRLLNRAQRVLLDSTLRKQYDLLGIDLDDDEIDTNNEENTANNSSDKGDKDHPGASSSSTSSQGVLQEIASNVLAGVLQLGVRTMLLGVVSIIIVRYWFFVYPAYMFLLYTIYRMISLQQQSKTNASIGPVSIYDTIPTTVIAIGIFLMNRSITSSTTAKTWTIQYWIGEGLVIAMFMYNSFSGMSIVQSLKPMIVWGVIGISAALIALWFRGNVWNYLIVIVIIAIVALLVAMAFPIMELIVEAILNEKLRKVGDKVRHHHQILHTHYEKKYSNSSIR